MQITRLQKIIEDILITNKITASKLASELGISNGQLSFIRNGKVSLPRKELFWVNLAKLCDQADVDCAYKELFNNFYNN